MLKKIESIIATIILIGLVLTLGLRLFSVETFVIQSDSMAPKYRVNDLVYVEKLSQVSESDLTVGDVIAFNLNGQLVMHRIISLSDKQIVTQGDNNDVADNAITYQEVYGKVQFNLKFGGIIFNMYFWIIVIGLYFTAKLTFKIVKEFKKGA